MKEKEVKKIAFEKGNVFGKEKFKEESDQGLVSILDDDMSKRKEIGDKILEKKRSNKEYSIKGEKEFWDREDIVFHQLNDYFQKFIDTEKERLIKTEKFEKGDLVRLKFDIDDLPKEISNILGKSGFVMIDGKINKERAKIWFNELFGYDRKMNMYREKRYKKWKWQFPLDIAFESYSANGKTSHFIWVSERVSVQEQKQKDSIPWFKFGK